MDGEASFARLAAACRARPEGEATIAGRRTLDGVSRAWLRTLPADSLGRAYDAFLEVNKGQTVVFMNDDDTSHNITVTGDGGVSVNSGLQPPGGKFEMPFAKPGTYQVTCGIHPKMKMTIVVK